MATNAGWSAFLDGEVNVHLKAMLNEWAMFLKSPESTYVLNEDPKHGWFGEDAKKAMPTFISDFKCDPTAVHYGFKSWMIFLPESFAKAFAQSLSLIITV